ncbi:hypothetical protein FPRO06_00204 [Fusarium proliferatum]|nr:hypothetical protein FPRO03_00208 [Fusarium proliferatum]KAG4273023.1 hypothetical protein FPRO04_10103 [Fusarium proliferatum]KAG4293619.1 hypothetical protein FPRO06_00204 [Fusarium proliferatum]
MSQSDPLLAAPTTIVHPKHKTWLCEEKVNGTECNTHNDVNDLVCMKCDYQVDGWTKVRAEDVNEIHIGQLHSYKDGVAKWQYFKHFLNPGPILEDAPGNNAPVPRGTIDG